LKYLSLVVYNRDLVVIKDMDTFARYYCYAKKQKPGLAIIDKALPVAEESGDDDMPAIEYEDVDPATGDEDIL
jgi:hypothetical protein